MIINQQKSILFISHDASRTGAPILLLNFLQWLKKNTNISFNILLKEGGSLEEDFKALAPVLVYEYPLSLQKKLINKGLHYFKIFPYEQQKKLYLNQLYQKLNSQNIGLIYSNTITNGKVLQFLSGFNCPVISHVHELEHRIKSNVGLKNFNLVKQYTSQYIAVSQAVKKNLIDNHDLSANKIDLIYESIPIVTELDAHHFQRKDQILEQLSIPKDAKIVCGSGTTDWRKSPDVFVLLARAVIQKYNEHPVYFLWVGGEKRGTSIDELLYDVNKFGLKENVRFLGMQSNPLEYFLACDVFALTSREDPFPLVCLEAASMGKPIVCFDEAGGEKEFVEDDCGFFVPYLDIEAMAAKIVDLLKSPELCQRLGQRAKQKVEERHNMEVVAPQILQVIHKCFKN